MIVENLKACYKKDLEKLKTEIELYKTEFRMWDVEKSIANSAGNLCLHLIGNLNAFIGVGLAGTNYVRHRDLEFSLKDIPREELLERLDDTMLVVETGLGKLTDDQLKNDFPIVIWDKKTEIGYTLIYLLSHLNYHLGQVNYHRRLLDN